MTIPSPLLLQHEVEQFLYHEAALLDGKCYDEWLDLFCEDAVYWLPSQHDQSDPDHTASIIYEDIFILRMRIERLKHHRAHALQPLPHTLHMVSNVRVTDTDRQDKNTFVTVRAALLFVEHREQTQRLYAASTEHRLRGSENHWRIAYKQVNLLDCDAAHGILSIPF